MKTALRIAIPMILAAAPSFGAAQSLKDTLCGSGHVNEISASDDVSANPDGYYIQSLKVQLSHDDPRIVDAVGDDFHLCTRSAATPDMDAARAASLMTERRVKYLFVPAIVTTERPGS